MFHEIFLAPFKHANTFRSPDVYRLPFVSGSTHTVMTPLRMPGFPAPLAEAIVATAANKITTAAAISFVERDFIAVSLPPASPRSGSSSPGIAFSEAGQEVAQVERSATATAHGYSSVGLPLPQRRQYLSMGSSGSPLYRASCGRGETRPRTCAHVTSPEPRLTSRTWHKAATPRMRRADTTRCGQQRNDQKPLFPAAFVAPRVGLGAACKPAGFQR